MKLENTYFVTQIFAGIAVVLSLIFVGAEIRQSTNAIYATSYDQLLSDATQWRMDFATSPIASNAFDSFLSDEDNSLLSQQEISIGQTVMVAGMHIWERAYFSRHYGRLGDEEWGRYQKIMCSPNLQIAINKTGSSFFSNEFWQYLQECTIE